MTTATPRPLPARASAWAGTRTAGRRNRLANVAVGLALCGLAALATGQHDTWLLIAGLLAAYGALATLLDHAGDRVLYTLGPMADAALITTALVLVGALWSPFVAIYAAIVARSSRAVMRWQVFTMVFAYAVATFATLGQAPTEATFLVWLREPSLEAAVLRIASVALALTAAYFIAQTAHVERLRDRLRHILRQDAAASEWVTGVGLPETGELSDTLEESIDEIGLRLSERTRRIERLDGMRRAALGRLSHDLRSALTKLHLYIESLQMGVGDPETHVAALARHGQTLDRMIDDLLALTTLEAPEPQMELEPCDPGELVDQACAVARPWAARRGVELVATAPAGDAAPLSADARLIQRLLQNLIDNAIQATPPGGRVTVSVARDGDTTELEVRDTGSGLPEEERERLFEPFQRGAAAQAPGLGLGLAIVHRIVELHRGEIRVESQAGGGTCFRVRLP